MSQLSPLTWPGQTSFDYSNYYSNTDDVILLIIMRFHCVDSSFDGLKSISTTSTTSHDGQPVGYVNVVYISPLQLAQSAPPS